MAKGADPKPVWENPLIPNARLRQIYVGLMQARTLLRAVPARRSNSATLGIEACLVSPAIDLGPGDLVSDALAGGVVEFLRGATLVEVLGSGRISRRKGLSAGCGEATALPEFPGVAERIWAALGAALALKSESVRAKIDAKSGGAIGKQASVVVAYALPIEITSALWRKALKFAREKQLPVLFVVLPAMRTKNYTGHSVKPGKASALAIQCGVPGIAVDADDAVALYRVAQESIGHARTGGGPALMECVPFVIDAMPRKHMPNAIEGLEQYMLQRGVATQAWMQREEKSFATRTAKQRAASK